MNVRDRAVTIATVAMVAASMLALVGCASGGSGIAMKSAPSQPMPMTAAKDGATVTDASYQTCANCAGKGMAPMTDGKAVDVNGVQVLKIGVKNGYYTPNTFTVKAGMPVKVEFAGKAKGCLAKPQFKALNKKGDFTGGTATIDLGSLQPGTFEFSCGMGMTGGKIVAQ